MGGRRTTKEELAQLEALTKEGLTCSEIGQKLARSPSAIRNLRYEKHLITRVGIRSPPPTTRVVEQPEYSSSEQTT